jgi:RNA polymerase sigma-70 factor (ECF subfamily)
MQQEESLALIRQVQAGDRDAFRVLVERHSQALFRTAFRMTGNESDAEEIVQETFLKAYKSIGRFESRSTVSTWLTRIAINCSLDLIAQRKPSQPLTAVDDDGEEMELQIASNNPSPERHVLSDEVRERVTGAMGQLTSAERTAFVLRHFEGRSIEEISSVLAIKAGAAKNTIFRAVQKLRQALEPLGKVAL